MGFTLDQWDYFVKTMFNYSLTRRQPNDKEIERLSAVLYEETQGITDLLVKTFAFSQERAIEVEQEKITPAIIRSVVKDKFQLLRPALKAFRNKDKESLRRFDDAYPLFLDDLMAHGDLATETPPNLVRIEGEISEEPEVKILIDQQEDKDLRLKLFNDEKDEVNLSEKPPTKKRKRTSSNGKKEPKGEILNIINNSDNKNENAYDLLKSKGMILSAETFFSEGVNQEEKL